MTGIWIIRDYCGSCGKTKTMKGKEIPLSRRFVQGAIGKKFVIKHYKYGIVQTKFPAMQHIIPTGRQVKCRQLFKEAVAFAKIIMANNRLKQRWIKRTHKKRRVFNAIIKIYMLLDKKASEQAMQRTNRLLRNCFKFSKLQPASAVQPELEALNLRPPQSQKSKV